ncbi:11229_t:CDS:2 [Entrophospora sp. SA101]|nr:11229_t:CDS:2 [Entrophospora sp. SA101]
MNNTKYQEFLQKKKNLIKENEALIKEHANLETVIEAQRRRNEIETRQKDIADELLKIHVEFLQNDEDAIEEELKEDNKLSDEILAQRIGLSKDETLQILFC